jgi:signal transduction histidine kinase
MRFAVKLSFIILIILLIFGASTFYFVDSIGSSILENEITKDFETLASNTMITVDRYLNYRITDAQAIASDPIISSPDSTPLQITQRLIEFRNIYKNYISMSFFRMDRVRIADTAGLDIGKQRRPGDYWTDIESGKDSALSIFVSESLDTEVIGIAQRVKDRTGNTLGIIVIRIPLVRIHELIKSALDPHILSESTDVDLIDNTGLVLYSDHNPTIILKEKIPKWQHLSEQILNPDISSTIHQHLSQAESIYIFANEKGYLQYPGKDWILILQIPTAVALAPINQLRQGLIWIFLLILPILIGAAILVSKSVTKPITQLGDATKLLEKGDFTAHVEIKEEGELKELGEAFNRSIEALGRIDQEHKELDKAKTEFLSITSHELRSPMTPMKAQLQMLDQEYFGKLNKTQKEAVEVILRNSEHLDKIIMDFLEISRIEAARLKFSFKKTDLTETINKSIELMKMYMPENNVHIIAKISKLPIIDVDSDRVAQVLNNLLNNAIKFSHVGSTVELTAKPRKDDILFSVKDNGIGISKKAQSRIFEPFFQGEETMYRKYGGTGLGLAICKGIIESQNGKIWFESEENKGTTFYFTVPFKPVYETKPIKLLFTAGKALEDKLMIKFKDVLGPIGETEFTEFKAQHNLTETELFKYIDNLIIQQVLDKEQGKRFKKEIEMILAGQ